MAKTYKAEWGELAIRILPSLSIAVITFFAYQEILGFFFTTRDALTLIDTSRVRTFHDISRILSEPLMNGTTFHPLYYRPIAVLSYSLDYALWRMTPFGYHLTDLALHTLVSLLVYSLLLRLSNGDRLTAWLGAIIFSIHPILTKCVPGIERRQDILAAVFFLGSMLFFLEYLHAAQKSRLLLSVVSYGLSLGSKEISVILLVVLVAYLVLVHNQTDRALQSIKAALITVLPYFMITFTFFAWRFHVLQGVGGKQIHPQLHLMPGLVRTTLAYFYDLVYGLPQVFTTAYHLVPTPMAQAASLLIILSLIIVLAMHRHFLARVITDQRDWITAPVILLVFAASASLLGLLVYPLLSSPIMSLITEIYEGQGPTFLAKVVNVKPPQPAEYYFDTVTGVVLTLLLVVALSSIIILSLLRHHSRTGEAIRRSDVRLISFLAVWLLLPLSLYILPLPVAFRHRHMYLYVIPFICIISLLLVGSGKAILARRMCSLTPVHGGVFLMSALLVASAFWYSPLVRPLDEWKNLAQMQSIFLHKFSALIATAQLPDDSVVHLYNLPSGTNGLSGLSDYSIKSWFNLQGLGSKISVIVQSESDSACFHKDLILEPYVDRDAKEMKVNVKYI